MPDGKPIYPGVAGAMWRWWPEERLREIRERWREIYKTELPWWVRLHAPDAIMARYIEPYEPKPEPTITEKMIRYHLVRLYGEKPEYSKYERAMAHDAVAAEVKEFEEAEELRKIEAVAGPQPAPGARLGYRWEYGVRTPLWEAPVAYTGAGAPIYSRYPELPPPTTMVAAMKRAQMERERSERLGLTPEASGAPPGWQEALPYSPPDTKVVSPGDPANAAAGGASDAGPVVESWAGGEPPRPLPQRLTAEIGPGVREWILGFIRGFSRQELMKGQMAARRAAGGRHALTVEQRAALRAFQSFMAGPRTPKELLSILPVGWWGGRVSRRAARPLSAQRWRKLSPTAKTMLAGYYDWVGGRGAWEDYMRSLEGYWPTAGPLPAQRWAQPWRV